MKLAIKSVCTCNTGQSWDGNSYEWIVRVGVDATDSWYTYAWGEPCPPSRAESWSASTSNRTCMPFATCVDTLENEGNCVSPSSACRCDFARDTNGCSSVTSIHFPPPYIAEGTVASIVAFLPGSGMTCFVNLHVFSVPGGQAVQTSDSIPHRSFPRM